MKYTQSREGGERERGGGRETEGEGERESDGDVAEGKWSRETCRGKLHIFHPLTYRPDTGTGTHGCRQRTRGVERHERGETVREGREEGETLGEGW